MALMTISEFIGKIIITIMPSEAVHSCAMIPTVIDIDLAPEMEIAQTQQVVT